MSEKMPRFRSDDAGDVYRDGTKVFACIGYASAADAVTVLNRMHEALKEAEAMRRYQRGYFKDRDKRTLMASKLSERRFDQLLKLALR